MLSPPLLVIFAKSPTDGKPGIDKAENRYYTTNISLLGHCSAFLGVMPQKNTSRGTAFAKAAIRQAQALNKGMGTSPALTNTVCV